MTPLFFILIVAAVLTLLIYWVLNTIKDEGKRKTKLHHLDFESAQELSVNAASEFYLAQNAIKIQPSNGEYGLAYWNLSRAKWEDINAEYGMTPDMKHIVLRVNEAGELVHYSDMWVRTIVGQCKFPLQPHTAYYVTLGVKHRKHFIPILTSNTIMRQD